MNRRSFLKSMLAAVAAPMIMDPIGFEIATTEAPVPCVVNSTLADLVPKMLEAGLAALRQRPIFPRLVLRTLPNGDMTTDPIPPPDDGDVIIVPIVREGRKGRVPIYDLLPFVKHDGDVT